ncbi:MAG: helix-turn-helix domain-containing protein [Acidimicrobiales bacterium]
MMTPDEMERRQKQFGRMVRSERTGVAALSVEELARQAACDVSGVTSLEAGDPTCDYAAILRICAILGIDEDAAIIFEPGVIF